MEFDPHDQDIVRLLTKLKNIHGEYPQNLLVTQRQSYLKRITEIELGMSGGSAIRTTAQNAKYTMTAPAASTLLEAALVVAIVAEASVMAYFYRDKLAGLARTIRTGAEAQQATSAPLIPTSQEIQGSMPSPAIASTTLTASPTGLSTGTPASGTPLPAMAGDNDNSTTPGLSSTPAPNGNNGNHYGQTPKPERTKENNGNNNPKDKPTKDKGGKPPKDKPTQTK